MQSLHIMYATVAPIAIARCMMPVPRSCSTESAMAMEPSWPATKGQIRTASASGRPKRRTVSVPKEPRIRGRPCKQKIHGVYLFFWNGKLENYQNISITEQLGLHS